MIFLSIFEGGTEILGFGKNQQPCTWVAAAAATACISVSVGLLVVEVEVGGATTQASAGALRFLVTARNNKLSGA